jgi:DNA-binding transcriptional LysR family regulator
MSLDTITLQCFLAVSDTGSFTKAADRVGRTQSAISQQIAKLEHLLGKTLFHRGREFSLTPEGEVFLTYARQMYALHCQSLDHFKAPELQGEIRFGLPEDFASVILSDVLIDFARLHPRILLNVECDLTLNLLENYKKGIYDLILVKTTMPEELPDLYAEWIEPVKWIGKPELLPQFNPDSIIPLVLSPQPCVYRQNAIQALERAGIKWRLVYSSPSYAGKMAAVNAGLGITIMHHAMIPPYLQSLQYDFLPPLQPINISLIKQNKSNKAIDSLEECLLKKLR